MFNAMAATPSLADIAAVTGNNRNNDGWGDGNGWWVLIILFAIFGGWGNNGWGNNGAGNQGALTRGDLCQDMNFSDLEGAVRGVSQGLCDGFYAVTQSVMNTNAIQQQIQQCCCDDQMRDMQMQFTLQQQHCDTLQAVDRIGDRIIDYMSAQQMQTLRDENQALRLAASQQAQNNYLVSQLRPCPEPAYIVPNPFCCNTQTYNGCGNTCC